jgi:hypothetical protein
MSGTFLLNNPCLSRVALVVAHPRGIFLCLTAMAIIRREHTKIGEAGGKVRTAPADVLSARRQATGERPSQPAGHCARAHTTGPANGRLARPHCSASARVPADARPMHGVVQRLTALPMRSMNGGLMPSDPDVSMKSVTTRNGRQLSRDLGRPGGRHRGL